MRAEQFDRALGCWEGTCSAGSFVGWLFAEFAYRPVSGEDRQVSAEHCHIVVHLVVGSQGYFAKDSQDYFEGHSHLVLLGEDSRPVQNEASANG